MTSSTLRVLLIDDEESDHLMTRALLGRIEGASLEVEWASTYRDGLDRLGERRHDVCLLDYLLDGDRTGLELLRQARSQAIRTPIILLTGKGSRELDLEAMKSGAVDYLVKGTPDPEAVERALRYAVERHRAQEALRQSEERHRGMFDHLPLGLYRVTEQGEYIEANPALTRILGFPERDALHQVHARNFFVSPRDREMFRETLIEQGVVLGFETEIRTSSGRPIRVRNTARVQRGPAGTIEYVEGTVEEDLSSARPAEEAEAESAAFRALLKAAPFGLLSVDPGGRIQDANGSAASLLGTKVGRLFGSAVWDLFPPEDGAMIAAALEEVARGEADPVRRVLGRASAPGAEGRHRVTLTGVPGAGGELGSILVLLERLGGDPEG